MPDFKEMKKDGKRTFALIVSLMIFIETFNGLEKLT